MSVFFQKVMKPLGLDGITRRSRKKSSDYAVNVVPEKSPLMTQESTNVVSSSDLPSGAPVISPGELRRKKILDLRWSSTEENDENHDTSLLSRKERLAKLQGSISWLRKELIDMRAMDQQLITQLMDIRKTIHQLKMEDSDANMDEFESPITYSKWNNMHDLGDHKGKTKANRTLHSNRYESIDEIDVSFEIEKADLTFDIKQMLDVCL
ncbi:uncharacterized protein [Antedon mediterranea]|uniref:uncharacterized protein n=1 Tax=Antedon mediterranea TaxID=105859 RepID=UPI003AF6232A